MPLPALSGAMERRSTDFDSDALGDGRLFRCFTLVDGFTCDCPAIEISHYLPALRMIQVLERMTAVHGHPRNIVCDNGPEFEGQAHDRWAHEGGIALQCIRPGKSIETALIEGFNVKCLDECLSVNSFRTLRDAQHAIETRRHDDNAVRPRESLHSSRPIPLSTSPRKLHRRRA